MKPSASLDRVDFAARRRLRRLRELAIGIQFLSGWSLEAHMSYVVVELVSTWSNFARSFFLSCTREATGTRGTIVRIAGGPLTYDQALGNAVLHWRPKAESLPGGAWHRRDEPAWHDPQVLVTACQLIGSSNVSDVRRAFSAGSRVFSDLPVFRNFYAHRGQQTQRAAVDLASINGVAVRRRLPNGKTANKRPSEVLFSQPIAKRSPLLLEWLDDISFTVEFLCE